jgi:hypothetical protein
LKLFEIAPAKPPSPEQQERNYYAKEQQAPDEIAAKSESKLQDRAPPVFLGQSVDRLAPGVPDWLIPPACPPILGIALSYIWCPGRAK